MEPCTTHIHAHSSSSSLFFFFSNANPTLFLPQIFFDLSHFSIILLLHLLFIHHQASVLVHHSLSKVSFLHFALCLQIRNFDEILLSVGWFVLTVICLMMGSACMQVGMRRVAKLIDYSHIYGMHTKCLLKCLKGNSYVSKQNVSNFGARF